MDKKKLNNNQGSVNRSPLKTIKDIANELSTNNENKIIVTVNPHKGNVDKFLYSLVISSHQEDYTNPIFDFSYSEDYYPVTITAKKREFLQGVAEDLLDHIYPEIFAIANDENELLEILNAMLNCEKTKKIITAIVENH